MKALRTLLGCLAWAAALPVLAQQATMLEPSLAVQCLTRGTEPATYPPDLFERRDSATIEVELSFTSPDAAPRLTIKDGPLHHERFDSAIRSYVKQFRVPCLQPNQGPVVLRQTYVFIPNDGRKVAMSTPVDERSEARRAKLACITHVRKIQQPDYPDDARRLDVQGPVIVNLRFTKSDAAPEIRVLAAAHNSLRREIVAYSAGLRLPCLDGDDISLNRIYQFRILGGERTVLKDTKLAQLLAAARNLAVPVYFDFGAMGCPFDVRMSYFQPYLENDVYELESSQPARRPFLDWLSRLTLNLDEKRNLGIAGQQMNISVPCGTLDL
jgi:hypothetical protein